MVVSNEDILAAIKELGKQNQALQENLRNLARDNADLRHDYADLVDNLEMLLMDKNDGDTITWSAKVIAEKTHVPLKKISRAMRTGDLTSIPIHKRGKGYVRVASPENVRQWLQKQVVSTPTPPSRANIIMRRKPPNVVF